MVDLPTVTWIDEASRNDTIITKYSLELKTVDALVYYARRGWQQNTSTAVMRGYRMIASFVNDSIYINSNDNSGNYEGPYQFRFSADGQQLMSQDILDAPANSQGRVFVRLQ